MNNWGPAEGEPAHRAAVPPGDHAFLEEVDALLRLAADATRSRAAVAVVTQFGNEGWQRAAPSSSSANPGDSEALAAAVAATAESTALALPGSPDGAPSSADAMCAIASLELRSTVGRGIGRLYLVDDGARELTARQLSALRIIVGRLARAIELEHDRGDDAVSPGRRARFEGSAGFARTVLDATTNGLLVLDLSGAFTYLNRRALEIGGYEEHEVIGSHFSAIVPPEHLDAVQSLFDRAVTLGDHASGIELEIARKDGSRAFVRFGGGPLVREGRTVAITVTAEDITDRVRTERLVAAQRDLLEQIALGTDVEAMLHSIAVAVEQQSSALCSIILLEPDGETLHVSAAPSLPVSMTEVVNQLKIGPAVGSCGTALYRRAPVITRDVQTDPLWAPFRDMMAIHGLRSSWSAPFFDEEGNALGTLAIYSPEPGMPTEWDFRLIDFATHLAGIAVQRGRIRARIVESEARYRDLFENANDILYTHAMDGTFLSVNAAGLKAYGYTPDDIGTLNISQIVDADSRRAGDDLIRDAARDGMRPRPFELLTHARDGHSVWIEVNTRVVHRADGSRFVQGTARDVTQRRLAEDALRQSETRYRALAENMFDVVTEVDAAGEIHAISENVESALGYSADELVGRNYLDIVHPDDTRRGRGDPPVDTGGDGRSSGPPAPRVYRFRHRDGPGARWRRPPRPISPMAMTGGSSLSRATLPVASRWRRRSAPARSGCARSSAMPR